MSKNNNCYSNTIIYKIYCKDNNITDTYVGHTTNFLTRKESHKCECKNLNNNSKIYKTIRENGGWNNWNMVEIAKYNCNNLLEARMKEQQHYEELNASLNSCPPYMLLKNFYCESCDFNTSRKSQYDRHLATDKHKKLQQQSTQEKEVKTYECKCGKKYKHSSTLYAHKKNCDSLKVIDKDLIIRALLKIIENGTNTNNGNNTNV